MPLLPFQSKKNRQGGGKRKRTVSVFAERRCIAAFLLLLEKEMIAACIQPAQLQMQCTITRSKVPAKMRRKEMRRLKTELAVDDIP